MTGMAETTNPLVITDRVLQEILAERTRQDTTWGRKNLPNGTGPLLMVMGRRAGAWAPLLRQDRQAADTRGDTTWVDLALEQLLTAVAQADPVKLRAELVQLAVDITGQIECIDRVAAATPAPEPAPGPSSVIRDIADYQPTPESST